MDVELADGVTIVRIDHPRVNAFDLGQVDDAVATVRSIKGPIVLTGAGPCFSAGVDLRAIIDGGPDYTDGFLTAIAAAFLAVFDHPAPVVAAINGHAIAGGCVLAMAADVRLMSGGLIGLSEVAVGVPFPVAALEICRYAMGPSVTRAVLQADNSDVQSASSARMDRRGGRTWPASSAPAGLVTSLPAPRGLPAHWGSTRPPATRR
jgi:enoyl-CoA hydratase